MVINEQGLVSAMKDAYKNGGYCVAQDEENQQVIIRRPGIWKVSVRNTDIPRKAIGLIAEHLGKLPEPGEAYQVRKKESQTVIYGVAVGESEITHYEKIGNTGLVTEDGELWQRESDNAIFAIDADYKKIMNDHGRQLYIDEQKRVYLFGNISTITIALHPDSNKMDEMEFLGRRKWVRW